MGANAIKKRTTGKASVDKSVLTVTAVVVSAAVASLPVVVVVSRWPRSRSRFDHSRSRRLERGHGTRQTIDTSRSLGRWLYKRALGLRFIDNGPCKYGIIAVEKRVRVSACAVCVTHAVIAAHNVIVVARNYPYLFSDNCPAGSNRRPFWRYDIDPIRILQYRRVMGLRDRWIMSINLCVVWTHTAFFPILQYIKNINDCRYYWKRFRHLIYRLVTKLHYTRPISISCSATRPRLSRLYIIYYVQNILKITN